MAAAIALPLASQALTTLGPGLLNMIVGLVHPAAKAVENLPLTNPEKAAKVAADVTVGLHQAVDAGQIAGPVPPPETVAAVSDLSVKIMKAAKLLPSSTATALPTSAPSGI